MKLIESLQALTLDLRVGSWQVFLGFEAPAIYLELLPGADRCLFMPLVVGMGSCLSILGVFLVSRPQRSLWPVRVQVG